jgi:hypothetical protein
MLVPVKNRKKLDKHFVYTHVTLSFHLEGPLQLVFMHELQKVGTGCCLLEVALMSFMYGVTNWGRIVFHHLADAICFSDVVWYVHFVGEWTAGDSVNTLFTPRLSRGIKLGATGAPPLSFSPALVSV